MLYKVTPMMPSPEAAQARSSQEAPRERKRKSTSVYDHLGREVLISLMCLKCRTVKPLAQFGLRKMADGAVRNQPWCRVCRSASVQKREEEAAAEAELLEALEPVRSLASL